MGTMVTLNSGPRRTSTSLSTTLMWDKDDLSDLLLPAFPRANMSACSVEYKDFAIAIMSTRQVCAREG